MLLLGRPRARYLGSGRARYSHAASTFVCGPCAASRPRSRRGRRGRAPRDAAARGQGRRDGRGAGPIRAPDRARRRRRLQAPRENLCRRGARRLLARRRGHGRPGRERRGRRGGTCREAVLQRRRRPTLEHLHHAGHRRPRAGHDRDRQQRPVARAGALDQRRHRDAAAGAAGRTGGARRPLAAPRARASPDPRAAPLLGRRHRRRRRACVRGP